MANLHLIHTCAHPRAMSEKPTNAATARVVAVVGGRAYPPQANNHTHQVMARPDSVPYLVTEPPGVNIHRLRTARGWSQSELARRCEPPLDASAVSRLEHNNGFTQDSLERVSAALGVPYQSLFYPAEMATYARLPAEIRRRLADTIADAAAAYDARKPPR